MRRRVAASIAFAGLGLSQNPAACGAAQAQPPRQDRVADRYDRAPAPRWGGQVDGRWWGGARAPGGWSAYRRPVRGTTLPRYWDAPGWAVDDWARYGLPQPPQGYRWSRYYDDAVLLDPRGGVYDSIGGVRWDRFDGPEPTDGYVDLYAAAPRLPYPTRDADDGLGGAAIGGVAGGLAGAALTGGGLGGTLIGAGGGALAGMAIDRSDRAGRVPAAPPPRYGASYPAPAAAGRPLPPPAHARHVAPPPPGGRPVDGPPVVAYQQGSYGGNYAGTSYSGVTYYGAPPLHAPVQAAPHQAPAAYPMAAYPGTTVLPNGTIVTSTSAQVGGGYYAAGYYWPGTTVTTVTVQSGGSGAAYEETYEERAAWRGKGRRYTKGRCHC